MKNKTEEQQQILANSVSRRIMFVAVLSLLREMVLAYMYDVVYTDKRIINDGARALNRMFREFDANRVGDNPYHDGLLDKLWAHVEDLRKQTEDILLNREKKEDEN